MVIRDHPNRNGNWFTQVSESENGSSEEEGSGEESDSDEEDQVFSAILYSIPSFPKQTN